MKLHLLTRTAIGALASSAVLLPLTACGNGDEGTGATGSTSADPSTTTPEPAPTSPGASSSEYQDGTYTARGVYGGAPSHMDFTISLEDGVITGVDSELMEENNETSRGYQERFAAAVPDEVLGESIEDLEVGVLAGASGCADGFNDALAKIRGEARADAGQTSSGRR